LLLTKAKMLSPYSHFRKRIGYKCSNPKNFFLEDLVEKKAMILSQGLVKLRGAFFINKIFSRSYGLGVCKILARKCFLEKIL
jgi:hypothetical protein